MPSLIKRRVSKTNGKISYQVGVPLPDGSYEYATFAKKRDATKWLAEKRLNRSPKRTDNLILEAFLQGWLQAKKPTIRHLTFTKYESLFRLYVLPALGKQRVREISTADLQAIINNLVEKQLSSHSVADAKKMLSAAFGHAQKLGYIKENPAKNVICPRAKTEREKQNMSLEELEAFLKAAEKECTPYKAAFRVLASTGLRPSELSALKWEDVGLGTGKLRVNKAFTISPQGGYELAAPKSTSSNRTVPLSKSARQALITWKELQQTENRCGADGFIFTNKKGAPIWARQLSAVFRRVAKRAGLEGFSLYSLRHTYACLLLSQKISIKAVSRLLGHSDISITLSRYIHVLPSDLEEVSNLLDSIL